MHLENGVIKPMDIRSDSMAKEILELQLPSYRIEAELIGFYGIPALKDTVASIKDCGESFYGYYANGVPAGFISFKLEEGILDIYRLVVHPDFFRKGIASRLLDYIEEQHGSVSRIIVSTGSRNFPAVSLYLRKGFSITGEREVAPGVFVTIFEKACI